jgi:hypothetical protein
VTFGYWAYSGYGEKFKTGTEVKNALGFFIIGETQ